MVNHCIGFQSCEQWLIQKGARPWTKLWIRHDTRVRAIWGSSEWEKNSIHSMTINNVTKAISSAGSKVSFCGCDQVVLELRKTEEQKLTHLIK